MKCCFTYLALLLCMFRMHAQNTVLARVSPTNNKVIQVKWYFPKLINMEGFNVYRKENSGDWKKINSQAVTFKTHKISNEELSKDKELKNYLEIVSNPDNVKDLALLAVLIKSFKSDAFSKYLGIRFDDESTQANNSYEYKITILSNGAETDLASSSPIIAGTYKAIASPKNISFKPGNKKVSFKWDPQPDAYFGVNIYRKMNDTGQVVKITKDPLILSKAKNSKGEESYGEEFFVDGKLKPKFKYHYQLEAIDFFGSPSILSEDILVILKDQDAPNAPDSVYYKVDGKKAFIKWKKKNKEEDLLGYNIYRTTNNDTDFVKINQEPVSLNDSLFQDKVTKFGSYMYAVSCVDQDNNETVSNPFHVEVYDNEPPLKPENLTIQADSGRLTLRWNKNTEEDLKGYHVYRTINKNTEDTYVKMTPNPLSENIYTDVLPKNIKNKFLYKVVAVDKSLNRSPYSEFAIARMPDVTAPNAPFLKTISLNEKNQLVLEWLANAEPDLMGYSIYRKNISDSGSVVKKLNIKILDRNSFRYTDRYAGENALYEYYIEAIDSSMNSSKPSNHHKYKLKLNNEEDQIKITSFMADYNTKRKQVTLKWKLKNTDQLKTSIVYKMKPGESIFSPLSGTLEEEGFLDKDISEGQNYTYQLRVYNQQGDVYRSEKITLTIK